MCRSVLRELKKASLRVAVPILVLCVAGSALAQPPQSSLPVGSKPAASEPEKKDPKIGKNDRIFRVIPNYRTVENPELKFQPITVQQKFKLALDDSFDPYMYPLAGAFAALNQAQNDPKSWGQGWGAFAKRYAASFADQTDENMMTEAVLPGLLREDPR